MLANLPYVAFGLVVVALIAGGVWWFRHRPVPTSSVVGKTAVDSFVAGLEAPLDALRADIAGMFQGFPALVSGTVSDLQAKLAQAEQDRDEARAELAAANEAHAAQLAAVAQRVAAAVTSSAELAGPGQVA